MKKALALLFVVFALSFCSCGTLDIRTEQFEQKEESVEAENLAMARKLYDKMTESADLLDEVASDICSVWREADYDESAKEINEKIAKVKEEHKDKLDEIARLDEEINKLFPAAKASDAQFYVEQVMRYYIEYRDSILKADAAFDRYGYVDISTNKDVLDRHLNQLYVKL